MLTSQRRVSRICQYYVAHLLNQSSEEFLNQGSGLWVGALREQ